MSTFRIERDRKRLLTACKALNKLLDKAAVIEIMFAPSSRDDRGEFWAAEVQDAGLPIRWSRARQEFVAMRGKA